MKQDERAPFVAALETARVQAYPVGEFVGQESFMLASEIRSLVRAAGIASSVRVLDLCCGIAGPGRMITAETGCDYTGVDYSTSALALARGLAIGAGLDCRFVEARLPPIPAIPADVVLLLETILAFSDKATLIHQVSELVESGGRFALTLEEGQPLTPSERAAMPDADTVWLTPLPDIMRMMDDAGLRLRWVSEVSRSHQRVAQSLLDSFSAHEPAIADQIGARALRELVAAHQLWVDWLASGRVRKFALVAERPAG